MNEYNQDQHYSDQFYPDFDPPSDDYWDPNNDYSYPDDSYPNDYSYPVDSYHSSNFQNPDYDHPHPDVCTQQENSFASLKEYLIKCMQIVEQRNLDMEIQLKAMEDKLDQLDQSIHIIEDFPTQPTKQAFLDEDNDYVQLNNTLPILNQLDKDTENSLEMSNAKIEDLEYNEFLEEIAREKREMLDGSEKNVINYSKVFDHEFEQFEANLSEEPSGDFILDGFEDDFGDKHTPAPMDGCSLDRHIVLESPLNSVPEEFHSLPIPQLPEIFPDSSKIVVEPEILQIDKPFLDDVFKETILMEEVYCEFILEDIPKEIEKDLPIDSIDYSFFEDIAENMGIKENLQVVLNREDDSFLEESEIKMDVLDGSPTPEMCQLKDDHNEEISDLDESPLSIQIVEPNSLFQTIHIDVSLPSILQTHDLNTLSPPQDLDMHISSYNGPFIKPNHLMSFIWAKPTFVSSDQISSIPTLVEAFILPKQFYLGQKVFYYHFRLYLFPGRLQTRWIGPCISLHVHYHDPDKMVDPLAQHFSVIFGYLCEFFSLRIMHDNFDSNIDKSA